MSITARTVSFSQVDLINRTIALFTTSSFPTLFNPRPYARVQTFRIALPQTPPSLFIHFHSSSPPHGSAPAMSDDASYASFLDKANQDTGILPLKSGPKSAQALSPDTAHSSSNIPSALQNISATYTSDTDSSFEPVSFDYDGSELPSAQEFEKLVAKASGNNGPARWKELSEGEFDPRGEYVDVVKKVKGVVEREEVKVFRVGKGKTRAEYYVVGLGGGKVVGVRAEAVES